MFIPYKPAFDEAISQLLETASYSLIWGKESITTFLAIENDKLIGLGSLWKNSIRPYREYIGIYIDPEYRKKGIGKELFNQVWVRIGAEMLYTQFNGSENQQPRNVSSKWRDLLIRNGD